MLQLGLGRLYDAPLRLLCLGAHSDDIEIGCGGSILRLLRERPGSTVHWVVFAAPGSRSDEARSSAEAFLARAGQKHIEVHAFRESYFPFVGAEIKDAFEALKARFSPDVVLSHRADDLHQDHRTIAELTWNTFRNSLVLQYEIPKYEGDLGTPNVFLPLERADADRKVELLMDHFPSQAQRRWFHPDTFHGLMSLRGIECNAPERRAEAFYARKLVL
ncbi:MAG TPA: PIG-L deacetylase family protein [Polyangiaceae bacterium]|nr:PIG-L deacetylase family protein [Polyangiaceae bacterium]